MEGVGASSVSCTTFAVPLNAQGVQDKLVSLGQMAAVQNYPVGITNVSVARDAPRLMASDARAMITACVLAVLVVTGRFGWWAYRHRIVLLFSVRARSEGA